MNKQRTLIMKLLFTQKNGLAALLLWMAPCMLILGQSEEQIEKFRAERQAYFTENLALTDAEAEAFWPVYDDYFNRKLKIMDQERNTFRYARENEGNMSPEEIESTLEKILDLKGEMIKLEQEFYGKKFPKILPSEKVLKLYKVEWDYRRHLLRELRRGGKGPEGGPGGPPGHGRGQGNRPPLDEMRP